MLKFNNRNTRTRCEIYSKLTKKTPECSIVFTVNFAYISTIFNFEQVNAGWENYVDL